MVDNKPQQDIEYFLDYNGYERKVKLFSEVKGNYVFLGKTANHEVFEVYHAQKDRVFVLGDSVVSATGFVQMKTTRSLLEEGALVEKLKEIVRGSK